MKLNFLRFTVLFSIITIANLLLVSPTWAEDDKPLIAASILPQKYFIQQVAKDDFRVEIMVPPGANPATYEPKPSQLVSLSKASAYMAIGVPFEKTWLKRFSDINKGMMIVDTTAGITKMPAVSIHNLTLRKNSSEESTKHPNTEELDPHIWLSPRLVKIQAKNIYNALISLDPANQKKYRHNLEDFLAELNLLDEQIRHLLLPAKGRKFLVFHPSWGYFAKDYNLTMIPIEVEGNEPSASELAKIIDLAKKEGIKIILTQPEFNARSAEIIAKEIGCKVVPISPLSPDWHNNLLNVANALAEALSDK